MTPSASTTVDLNDHAAAAAYLIKHRGTTVLVVLDGERADRPMGIITKTGIDLAAAHGKDLNKIRIQELIPQSPDHHQRGDEHP